MYRGGDNPRKQTRALSPWLAQRQSTNARRVRVMFRPGPYAGARNRRPSPGPTLRGGILTRGTSLWGRWAGGRGPPPSLPNHSALPVVQFTRSRPNIRYPHGVIALTRRLNRRRLHWCLGR